MIEVHEDASAVATAAARQFIVRAMRAMDASGQFSVVLSGGTTPIGMFRRLAASGSSDSLRAPRWDRVHFFWGDERAVSPDDPESNFGTARRELLDELPVDARNVHRIRGELGAEAAARRYEAELRGFFRLGPSDVPRFDLIFLGVGADGHTASLFPGEPALGERERLAIRSAAPKPPKARVTLTYPVLSGAAAVVFLATGEQKADTLRRVLLGPTQPDRLPAQGVVVEDGDLVWLVDRAAASSLPPTMSSKRHAQPERDLSGG
jgi:6-phosphogluconolactonase